MDGIGVVVIEQKRGISLFGPTLCHMHTKTQSIKILLLPKQKVIYKFHHKYFLIIWGTMESGIYSIQSYIVNSVEVQFIKSIS